MRQFSPDLLNISPEPIASNSSSILSAQQLWAMCVCAEIAYPIGANYLVRVHIEELSVWIILCVATSVFFLSRILQDVFVFSNFTTVNIYDPLIKCRCGTSRETN